MNARKMLIFSATLEQFLWNKLSLAGSQINPIDVNFHLQNFFENFDENSADKIWSKKDKVIKVSPLMPLRVKVPIYSKITLFWHQK